jgi:hypothetical protein
MAEDKPAEYMQVAPAVIAKWRALVGFRMLLRPESPDGHPVEATLEEVTDRAFIKLQGTLTGTPPWWRHMSLVHVLDVMPKLSAPPSLTVVPGGKDAAAPPVQAPNAAEEKKPAEVIPITRAVERASPSEPAQPAEPEPAQPAAPAAPKRPRGRPKRPKPADAP